MQRDSDCTFQTHQTPGGTAIAFRPTALLQGYYFSKPLEEQDFFALVAKNHEQPLAAIGDISFIIYSSIAMENIRREDMDDILKKARVRNAELDITGCLLYLDGGFMQYLEGPADALHKLMSIIKTDRRHHSVKEIVSGTEQRRMFLNWRMNFGDLETGCMSSSIAKLRAKSHGQGLNAVSSDPWQAYNLFHAMSLGLMA